MSASIGEGRASSHGEVGAELENDALPGGVMPPASNVADRSVNVQLDIERGVSEAAYRGSGGGNAQA